MIEQIFCEYVDCTPTNATNRTTFSFDSFPTDAEFTAISGRYTEYRTLGMSVEYIPMVRSVATSLAAGVAAGFVVASVVHKVPGAFPAWTTIVQFMESGSFQCKDGESKQTRIARMAGAEEAQWLLSSAPASAFTIGYLVDSRGNYNFAGEVVGGFVVKRLIQFRSSH